MKMKYGPSYNFYQEGEFETNFQEARKVFYFSYFLILQFYIFNFNPNK